MLVTWSKAGSARGGNMYHAIQVHTFRFGWFQRSISRFYSFSVGEIYGNLITPTVRHMLP